MVRWRSEVERHARGGSLDGHAANRVVGSIAGADLVAMSARPEPVVRALVVDAIAAADLCGPFVLNAGHYDRTIRQDDRSCSKSSRTDLSIVVATTIDLLVELVGSDRGERTVLIGQSRAVCVAVRAIGAILPTDIACAGTACTWEVAAAATRRRARALKHVAIGEIAVVPGVVLARRE